MTKVDELLIEGKVKEAIEIMCDLPEYEKEREQSIDLFENECGPSRKRSGNSVSSPVWAGAILTSR